jgi:hypothetical protein
MRRWTAGETEATGVNRFAHNYVVGAMSGTAVIAVAVAAFVLLVSMQAVRDWPASGLGLQIGRDDGHSATNGTATQATPRHSATLSGDAIVVGDGASTATATTAGGPGKRHHGDGTEAGGTVGEGTSVMSPASSHSGPVRSPASNSPSGAAAPPETGSGPIPATDGGPGEGVGIPSGTAATSPTSQAATKAVGGSLGSNPPSDTDSAAPADSTGAGKAKVKDKGRGAGAGTAVHGASGKGDDGLTETTETPSADPTGVAGNGKGADPAIPEEAGKALGHTKPEQ